MTGNATDFRIKLLVVHPDGRRQKFLVTFPERRSLKIDQRYIGLPLTLRVEFNPGATVCRAGTGHTLTVGGKPAKEHTMNVGDTVGLDQYSIEFLELPEPLPAVDEATRFVSINETVEATVIAPMPADAYDKTAVKPDANKTPRATQPEPKRLTQNEEVDDSTAVIRRLQVPGSHSNANPYASLQPSVPSRTHTISNLTNTSSGATQSGAPMPEPLFNDEDGPKQPRFQKQHVAIAVGALSMLAVYLFLNRTPAHQETAKHEAPGQETIGEAIPEFHESSAASELKPLDLPAAPVAPAPEPVAAAPVPQPAQPQMPSEPMGQISENPFDDKSGFDPMAIDQFFDAVDAGDEARIKDLLDRRQVDINLSRRRGYAALHLAAARGDLVTVKFLSKMKADPNVLDGSGATPLMWAVFRRHEDVVKFLAPKTNLKVQRQGGETAYDLAKRMNMKKLLSSLDPEPKKKAAAKKTDNKRIPTSLPPKKEKKK